MFYVLRQKIEINERDKDLKKLSKRRILIILFQCLETRSFTLKIKILENPLIGVHPFRPQDVISDKSWHQDPVSDHFIPSDRIITESGKHI